MSSITRGVGLRLPGALWVCLLLVGGTAFAQGTATLTGTVTDAVTRQPLAGARVTLVGPAPLGERPAVTDAEGRYSLPSLAPGAYTLRIEQNGYRTYSRQGLTLREDTATRADAQLEPGPQPGPAEPPPVPVDGVPPASRIDTGSTVTGVNVSSDFIRNLPVVPPGSRGATARSFESLSILAPGAQPDRFGISLNGVTSPENRYVIDGLAVNDPAFGLNATPLSVEFVDEVQVITGGYLPEHRGATGGLVNVVTKSGSDELHGAVWGNFAPGVLEGPRATLPRLGTSIRTDERLWNLGDFGVELGGPILKDKLWFFVGIAPSFTRYSEERDLDRILLDADGLPRSDPRTGAWLSEPLAGTRQRFFADERSLQYIGKLTWFISPDHSLTLSMFGTPTSSGGSHSFGLDPRTGATEVDNLNGPFEALAHIYGSNSTDVVLRDSSSFLHKKLSLDVMLGWHHQDDAVLPIDGSRIGGVYGLAGVARVDWRRTDPGFHTLADFERLPPDAAAACEPPGEVGVACPVDTYRSGGPGALGQSTLNRYQARAVGTYLLELFGHHVLKAGVDVEAESYHALHAYSGAVEWRESARGSTFSDLREYGFLVAPDQPEIAPTWEATSWSLTAGGFVQDSFSLLDLFTVNAGLRYDAQTLWGSDGQQALAFPVELSPRIGLVYDFTQEGRSRLFANYARYYEPLPLDLIDREFPGQRQLRATRFRGKSPIRPGAPGCNPLDAGQQRNECRDPRNLSASTTDVDPNSYWVALQSDASLVDPGLKPQSTDEFLVGGEYEVVTDARAGVQYTHRSLNHVVEDLSRDESASFFVGNPGEGIASDFPAANRTYDAVTVYLSKRFSDSWLAQVSYTWSALRGNYAGLFKPETGQLDPNATSDFDRIAMVENLSGPLPGDHTHQVKVFGAKQFALSGTLGLGIGVAYTGTSGAPLSVLGSDPLYGEDEVLLLPRGAAGRTPWVHDVDAHVGFDYKLSRGLLLTLSVDVFNVFGFQQVTAVDQRYTLVDVNPLRAKDCGGRCTLQDLAQVTEVGTFNPLDAAQLNPNYGHATAYQAPRSFRFGARLSF